MSSDSQVDSKGFFNSITGSPPGGAEYIRRLRGPHPCICEARCKVHQRPRNGDKIVKVVVRQFQFYHRNAVGSIEVLDPCVFGPTRLYLL